MKKFCKEISVFLFIIATIVVVDVLLQKSLFYKDQNVKLPENYSVLILGHSHPANAYDTNFVKNTINMGVAGEAYMYTYFKAKKVIDNNPQIKKIFIEYTNNQIDKGMDNWIWDDVHLQYRIKECWVLLDNEAIQLLYKKNPTGLINAFSKSLFDNLRRLFINKKGIIEGGGMGKFIPCDAVYVVKTSSARPKSKKNINYELEVSEYNILYLQKIVKYCQDRGLEVCLVRSPMHKSYDVSYTEYKFKEILHTKFRNVEWIDNKDFPIPDKGFQDAEHLNSYGAKIYSQYFNKLIN
jgi:hypothetical protein